ncbi:hypothetical protein CR513_58528, partial [Mucuna pruriens]
MDEQVTKFLHIIGHNSVLHAIIALEREFIVQPSGRVVSPQILNNSQFYPFFKDCLGVMDDTHIRAKVLRVEAPQYCGKKYYPMQNVFVACDFDMKFTCILTGWEDTTFDSRILRDALTREDPIIILELVYCMSSLLLKLLYIGKYYLVDVDFMFKRQILTSYRVFPIIANGMESYYPFETTRNIVVTCCILYKILISMDNDDSLIAEVNNELLERDANISHT